MDPKDIFKIREGFTGTVVVNTAQKKGVKVSNLI
jgi:hypothetical protein